MGAIAGVRPWRGGTEREGLIARLAGMRRAMAGRAPVEGGMAVAYDASIALAHGASRGPGGESVLQPLVDERGALWLVADGEPTNAADLRLELVAAGHQFRSASGAEVIVHLYAQGGIAALERLAGSFAFALWDRERQELLLGRDRLGTRPLYVATDDTGVAFASEVRALARGPQLHPPALGAFLTLGYLPEPLTCAPGVRAVEAGTILRLRDGRQHSARFWEEASSLPTGDRGADDAQLGSFVREAVEASVAGEDVGVLLDDGVASAALLALVRPMLGRGLRTHGFRFEDATVAAPPAGWRGRWARGNGAGGDDAAAARRVAAWFGAEHCEHVVTPVALGRTLEEAATADQPSIGAPLTRLGGQAMRAGGERVWLSSLAIPGLLGVPPTRAVGWLWRAGRRRSTRALTQVGSQAARRARPFGRAAAIAGYLGRADSVAAAYLATGGGLAPGVLATVLRPDVVAAAGAGFDAVVHLDGHVAHPPGPPCVVPPRSPRAALARALSAIELAGPVTSGVLRDTESAATAYGLAVRTPFLDHRLFEWVASSGAMDDGAPLLRVVGAAVPPAVTQRLRRPMPPLARWMRSALRPAVEDRLFTGDPEGWFVRGGIDALWSDFLAGRADWRAVWALAVVRGWISARRPRGAGEIVEHRTGRAAA